MLFSFPLSLTRIAFGFAFAVFGEMLLAVYRAQKITEKKSCTKNFVLQSHRLLASISLSAMIKWSFVTGR